MSPSSLVTFLLFLRIQARRLRVAGAKSNNPSAGAGSNPEIVDSFRGKGFQDFVRRRKKSGPLMSSNVRCHSGVVAATTSSCGHLLPAPLLRSWALMTRLVNSSIKRLSS